MRAAGDGAHGRRLRGLIMILWRAGLRIQEALALTEGDRDPRLGSLLVRRGKGGRDGNGANSAPRCERSISRTSGSAAPGLIGHRSGRGPQACATFVISATPGLGLV